MNEKENLQLNQDEMIDDELLDEEGVREREKRNQGLKFL